MRSQRIGSHRTSLAVLAVVAGAPLVLASVTAHAQQPQDDGPVSSRSSDAATAAREGMFMIDTVSPAADRTSPGTAVGYAGYDGASDSPTMEVLGDIKVVGPLDLRLGVAYGADLEEGGEEHEAQPHFGARVRVLSQRDHGIDGAFALNYRMDRFTDEEGLVQGMLQLGRHFGRVGAFANLGYAQDVEGDDREAELALGLQLETARNLSLGLESRARLDLFSDDEKRAEDASTLLDLVAGPTVHWSLGPVALLAQAGVHAAQLDCFRTGVIALGGVGYAY